MMLEVGVEWLTSDSRSLKSLIRLPANLRVLNYVYLLRFFNSDPGSLLSFNSSYKMINKQFASKNMRINQVVDTYSNEIWGIWEVIG